MAFSVFGRGFSFACSSAKPHEQFLQAFFFLSPPVPHSAVTKMEKNCWLTHCDLVMPYGMIALGRYVNGRIRLSVSTVNRTYELSGITHVTLFPKYGKHSTGPSTYGPWVRTYSKSFSCKPLLTVCSYRAQSNVIFTYGRVSRGSVPRVRRYGLLYLRAVEYDQYQIW